MCLETRTGSSTLSFLDWRGWATALRREYSARRASARRIDANDCSSWPTVTTQESANTNGPAQANRNTLPLNALAAQWPTARASDGEKGGPNQRDGSGSLHLPSATAQWPTPNVPNGGRNADSATIVGNTATRADGTKVQLGLEHHAKYFSLPAPPTPDGPTSSPDPRSLNPLFVEWLQGFPIGWTDYAPSATPSCRWLQRMRGALSTLG